MSNEVLPVTEIKAVLAGNPNCGKSTIFNHLSGAKQTIGNFPGVTVERYEGQAQYGGVQVDLIDLPGLYSLSSNLDEERVAGEYLSNESYDLIVNVVDASSLERNLYLTFQLKELNRPMVVVLNMVDLARRRGVEIDVEKLSSGLGVPVLETIGSRAAGIKELLAAMVEIGSESQRTAVPASKPEPIPEDELQAEEDRSCQGGCRCAGCTKRCSRLIAVDAARYNEISELCSRAVRNVVPVNRTFSDRIDSVLMNRWLGIPIFMLAMYLVFQLTFTLGQYPMDWLSSGFSHLTDAVSRLWDKDSFLESLVVDGVIGGVGGVLIFLPNILLLFLAITILEDSGYLVRAAVLCDRWMSKLGLPGRSIVPMLIGFGCTVPALMSTRMLHNRKERLVTMLILPLFSCGARFPIYSLLIPAFFPAAWRGPVLWLIYFIGIFLAAVGAKLLSAFFMKGDEASLIIELPPYHLPTFRTVGLQTLERGWQYLKKAGTVLLGISIVLWFLTSFPRISPEEHARYETLRAAVHEEAGDGLDEQLAQIDRLEAQANLSGSFAGRIGRFLEPALRPMGFDWRIGTALVGAMAAKEVFVAQLGIVYSVEEENGNVTGLGEVLRKDYTPLAGFCIMLFTLIATPCAATVSMMVKESGSWKWAFFQWGGLTLIAWILTTLVYQIGSH